MEDQSLDAVGLPKEGAPPYQEQAFDVQGDDVVDPCLEGTPLGGNQNGVDKVVFQNDAVGGNHPA